MPLLNWDIYIKECTLLAVWKSKGEHLGYIILNDTSKDNIYNNLQPEKLKVCNS